MSDPPRYPYGSENSGTGGETESTARSRWTKVIIVIVAVLFLAVIILHLLTGGGPGNH
jgi:hypothetical protein